jgi:plastocyanin
MDRASLAASALGLALVLPTTALADGGSISGTVDATPAKYLAETIVYLDSVPGNYPKRTHQMDQQEMKFVPRLLTIIQGDTVKFTNHDGVAHNVYSPDGEAYNLGAFKTGEERTQTFSSPGIYTQLCSIHPEMLGYVLVSQNPYEALVDEKGRYEIRGVPPGTYQVKVWNAHLPGTTRSVTVAAGGTTSLDLKVHR